MASIIFQRLCLAARSSHLRLPPTRPTHLSGGTNLEIFKFGMYIMFPIGWMYYFGTNLESRFSVPDFWPAPETTHRIPFEREELNEMAGQLKAERLERRRRRLEQARVEIKEGATDEIRPAEQSEEEQVGRVEVSRGTFGRGAIEKWARGQA
ncbi:hypothetical protein JMJ35_004537 [Cladonia borealis]|uniref:Mitochondrial cytochrome c oxidase assembly factor n=1 Tax=Cladonia borealis TaxID=184061 RepID=A0AA39V8E3_9LECA|nr:hypothetical protein JMJ35_004537 [Cladonia borealis]